MPAAAAAGDAEGGVDIVQRALGPNAGQRLHAIHPAAPGQEAAATAFALAVVQALARDTTRPLLWVQSEAAAAESGGPYGPGLAALGLDPARLVVVRVRQAMAVLAATEMGLEEAGLAGVIAELPARLPADMLRYGKRLSLRAEQTRTPCLLLHASEAPVEMPVASRWVVRGRACVPATSGGGRSVASQSAPDFTSAFEAALTKNRFGPLGRWALAWRPRPPALSALSDCVSPDARASHDQRFAFTILPPLSEPVAAAPADGSPAAAGHAQSRARRHAAA